MRNPYKSVFSYYGGKGKMAKYYPPPSHNLIIEPFAGAAAYSWRYHEHDVLVNDLDPKTFQIWSYLTDPDALRLFTTYVPAEIEPGQKCDELMPAEATEKWPGLLYLMQAEANQGTQGARGVHNQITKMGAKCWPIFVKKMRYVIPRIAHWKISNQSYEELKNEKATWFVDPPYANAAGRRYRAHDLDYRALGEWCRSREGQVIVCENEGADWLDFAPLNHGQLSIRIKYQRANAKEVVWCKD
jgi:site-specific DNA-adenine methylase